MIAAGTGLDVSIERAYALVAAATDDGVFVRRLLLGLRVIYGDVTTAYITEGNRGSMRFEAGAVDCVSEGPAARTVSDAETGRARDLDAPFYERRGSYAIAPLMRMGEAFGWIYVALDRDDFGSLELERLAAFASFGALIAQNIRMRERERAASVTDSLTGLPNRRALDAHIERRVRQPDPFVFCLFDLNNLKAINDGQGGHAAGDRAIQTFGLALKVSARASDMVARLGGDEFVAVLDGFESDQFIARVRGHLRSNGLTTSAGVAEYPHAATTAQELYALADANMYLEKVAGKAARAQSAKLLPRRRTTDMNAATAQTEPTG